MDANMDINLEDKTTAVEPEETATVSSETIISASESEDSAKDEGTMDITGSDQNGDPMDVEKETPSSTTTTTDEDDDTKDVIDQDRLISLLEQSKEGERRIEAEDILLFIGGTGAGKTTTTLYLAGAKFEEIEVGGVDHYEPSELPNPDLAQFAVSGGATSVTKTIHATKVKLADGRIVTICDTPGFGDTKGVEMEISNGLGIIRALQKTKSVKPVLVFDREGLGVARYTNLRKTLQTVVLMMGKQVDFSTFEYVFTRCDKKKAKKICKQLAHFQGQLRENPSAVLNGDTAECKILDALLSDMVAKTTPQAIFIEPDDEDAAPEILERLWCGNEARIKDSRSAFNDFVSKESADKLKLQIGNMLRRLDKMLSRGDFGGFEATTKQLLGLSRTLSFSRTDEAVKQARTKGCKLVRETCDQIQALAERMVGTSDVDPFKELAQDLQDKLSTMSRLDSIIELCEVPSDQRLDATIKAAATKIFDGLQNGIAQLEEASEVEGWNNDVKSMVLRVDTAVGAFQGHMPSDKLSPMYALSVQSLSSFVEHRLKSIQEKLEHPTSSALRECKGTLVSLRDLKFFFLKGSGNANVEAFRCGSWEWLGECLTGISVSLAGCYERSIDKLAEHTLEEDCESGGWEQTLLALSEDEDVVESRLFHVEASSVPFFCKLVTNVMEKEGEKSGSDIVADFDDAVNRALANFAESADGWASQKQPPSQKKKAMQLLKVGQAAAKVCKDHRASGVQSLDEIGEKLVVTMTKLEMFVERCNSMPQRPDDLLYGPEELGKQWHAKLVELRAYKIKHEDCNVPHKHPTLGRWVTKQRNEAKNLQAGKKSQMTDKRMEALADLDFVWSVKAESEKAKWEARFAELQEFEEANGHCRVPRTGRTKTLGVWVTTQRTFYSKGKLSKEKIVRLENIGFQWRAK